MAMLVVVRSFGRHQVGDVVVDEEIIRALSEGEHRNNTVFVTGPSYTTERSEGN